MYIAVLLLTDCFCGIWSNDWTIGLL